MTRLTPEGQQLVNDIAARYAVSPQAVAAMLDAVAAGGGTQAQFNIPELGGAGQWMQGGMTMVGDMFNYGLKMTVDNLCSELSSLYFNQGSRAFAVNATQSQGQGGGVSLFVAGGDRARWWPEQLGNPSSSGAQNEMRYAYFPHVNRIAVDAGGMICVYDTLDHHIGGFSQQQSFDGSITMTSQYGVVLLSSLPRVSLEDPLHSVAPQQSFANPSAPMVNEAAMGGQETFEQVPGHMDQPLQPTQSAEDDVLSMLERLGDLRDKGILTDDEFAAKKAELLSRL